MENKKNVEKLVRATGIVGNLWTYFQEHPGKVITVAELQKEFPQYDRRQFVANMYNLLLKDYAKNIERLENGVWRLRNKEDSKDGTLTVTIIKEADDFIISVDESGNVYKMIHIA